MLSLSLSLFAAVSFSGVEVNAFHATGSISRNAVVMERSVKSEGSSRVVIPWKGHFSAKNYETSGDKLELESIKKGLRSSILKLPRSHTQALKSLEIRNQKHESRGLANSKKIIIHTASVGDEQELQSVFIHELGHVVDLGKMNGNSGRTTAFWDGKTPVYSDDVSLKFYSISWNSASERKDAMKRSDFISGYAMTNCFEDFAESYVFYRLHGEKFRTIAEESPALKAKYDFMKTYVFGGMEYQKQKKETSFVHSLIWDATLVKF